MSELGRHGYLPGVESWEPIRRDQLAAAPNLAVKEDALVDGFTEHEDRLFLTVIFAA